MRFGLARLLGALIVPILLVGPAIADAAKYCAPDAANVVVYVDKTTPYDATDKTDLVDGVSRLFENLKGGERFTIRTIADSFTSGTSLLDQCVPFCPDQGMLGDLFGSCTEGVMLNDRKHLRQEVVRQLQSLLANFTELPNSEIVRTIGLSAPGELRAGGPIASICSPILSRTRSTSPASASFPTRTIFFSSRSPPTA